MSTCPPCDIPKSHCYTGLWPGNSVRYFSRCGSADGSCDEIKYKPCEVSCLPHSNDCRCNDCQHNHLNVCRMGEDGKQGPPGPDGPPGPPGSGDLLTTLITPTDNDTIIPIDTTYDVVTIDTSNYSPTLTLGDPGIPKLIELRMLWENGLPATIQLISGGSFVLSSPVRNVLLLWDGSVWSVIDNPANLRSLLPKRDNVTKVVPDASGVGLGTYEGSLALSSDGNTMAAGAPQDGLSGSTYIFVYSGGSWSIQDKLIGSNSSGNANQGYSVSLSADGNTLAVGGNRNNLGGSVWIFVRSGTTWSEQQYIPGPGVLFDEFGHSVDLSTDGNTLVVGARGTDQGLNTFAGAIYIYTRSGLLWTLEQGPIFATGTTNPDPQTGYSVAISADGNTVAAGLPEEILSESYVGGVVVWTRFDGVWTQQTLTPLQPNDSTGDSLFGSSVDLSSNGDTLAVGGPNNNATGNNVGAAWIFVRNNGIWTQESPALIAVESKTDPITTPPSQGSCVRLTGDGNTLAVGGPADKSDTGAVWIYRRIGTSWTQYGFRYVGLGAIGNALQGISLALSSSGNVMAVGGYGDNSDTGAVWIYR